MTNSWTYKLSEFVAGANYKDFSPEVAEMAKRAILDTLGVAFAGARESISATACALADEEKCSGEASIIGTSKSSSVLNCAFCSGVIFHALDFDDSYYDYDSPTRLHPSSPILAACFALAEKLRASGRAFLEAFVVGFEVTGALNKGLGPSHYGRGWHATSTLGIFGATAASSKLLQLTREQIQVAFGTAASLASGTRQNVGTMVKPLHVGHAARNGALAALLASRGSTADKNIFDEEMGFALFSEKGDWQPSRAFESLGSPWAIVQPGIRVKRYPSCGGTHKALDALCQILRNNRIHADDVEKVTVFVPEYPKALIHPRPQTGLQGKFSMGYCLAAGIIDGHVRIESFTDSAVLRPQPQALLRKVEVVERRCASDSSVEVRIRCRGGSEFSAKTLHSPGSPFNPLTWAELERKFNECVLTIMPPECPPKLIERIKSFEQLESLSVLMDMLRGSVS
jgi:2-methylcitrate dehydratase PrpD